MRILDAPRASLGHSSVRNALWARILAAYQRLSTLFIPIIPKRIGSSRPLRATPAFGAAVNSDIRPGRGGTAVNAELPQVFAALASAGFDPYAFHPDAAYHLFLALKRARRIA